LSAKAIRYTLINNNYRQQLNFTFESVKDSEKTILGLQNFIDRLRDVKESKSNDGVDLLVKSALNEFENSMDNDLSVPSAMTAVFDFVKKVNKMVDENEIGVQGAKNAIDFLKRIDSVIGVLDFSEKFFELTQEQSALIEERVNAKKNKDWKKADELRDKLKSMGILLVDNKDGTITAKPL